MTRETEIMNFEKCSYAYSYSYLEIKIPENINISEFVYI